MAHQHFVVVLLIWLLMPVAAMWLSTKEGQDSFSIRQMRAVSLAFTICATVLTLGVFTAGSRIRDAIGYKWVEGYSVSYEKDEEDGFTNVHWTANHWYARWALDAFGPLWLCACLGVPFLTLLIGGLATNEKKTRAGQAS
jgi:hypothetical protein